ncbi:MAG: cytidine deaminase [Anaerolineaceae bacterium]|nr:cytidine deaminase [Anaerolineaceae bacterium]MDE0328544.1 cytidine deaminase [Anaerolineaceae bacterium]MDE0608675.1 cytidine deaminase [Anaerolineaceae bacterium]
MNAKRDRDRLVSTAIAASRHAYVPYSRFPVGAALLAANGKTYGGCNVENAAYPSTLCAERTALVKAVSEGDRDFLAIAVVTRSGGSPCGSCRQMLYEFSPDMQVVVATLEGEIRYEVALQELLPRGFGPSGLVG